MANEFCTFEDACEMLGKSESDVKEMVSDGRLREFRDAGKVFFKRQEVKQIADKEGSSIVDLPAAEDAEPEPAAPGKPESFAAALSSLADESSSMGILDKSPGVEAEAGSEEVADASPIELGEELPDHLPAAPRTIGEAGSELTSEIDLMPDLSDSAAGISPLGGISPDLGLSPGATDEAAAEQVIEELEVPDLGLSGSSIISLEPGLEEATAPAKPADEKKGISVFDEDELQIDADPMGETRISSGVDELESVGSGSGLLDITRESDDTSLGAALLDVISPTEAAETEAEPAIVVEAEETAEDSGSSIQAEEAAPMYEAPAAAAPATPGPRVAVAAYSTGAVPMNVCVLLGLVSLALVGLATAAQIQGVWPDILNLVAKDLWHYSVFGGLAAIALAMGVIGILAGRGK